MGRGDERAAQNEVTFREANSTIEDRRAALGVDARTPYLCECEDERFLVVEKHGQQGELVEEFSG